LYWAFAAVLAGGQWVWKRNLLGVLFSSELQLPQLAWNRLLVAWTAFFLLLGSVNLVVAYRYSTETWVNFKTFGLLGLTFAYSISTGLYVARHLKSTTAWLSNDRPDAPTPGTAGPARAAGRGREQPARRPCGRPPGRRSFPPASGQPAIPKA